MATSDLLNELENPNFKTDVDTEKKICQIVLHQLEDSSSDISGLAVKWCVMLQSNAGGGSFAFTIREGISYHSGLVPTDKKGVLAFSSSFECFEFPEMC